MNTWVCPLWNNADPCRVLNMSTSQLIFLSEVKSRPSHLCDKKHCHRRQNFLIKNICHLLIWIMRDLCKLCRHSFYWESKIMTSDHTFWLHLIWTHQGSWPISCFIYAPQNSKGMINPSTTRFYICSSYLNATCKKAVKQRQVKQKSVDSLCPQRKQIHKDHFPTQNLPVYFDQMEKSFYISCLHLGWKECRRGLECCWAPWLLLCFICNTVIRSLMWVTMGIFKRWECVLETYKHTNKYMKTL